MLNDSQINKLTEHLIGQLDPSLLLSFFLIFSRFEYALKRSSYCIVNNSDYKILRADWCKFGKYVKEAFSKRVPKHKELEGAILYFETRPPKEQIKKNNQIAWKAIIVRRDDIQTIIKAVKIVRNNLFHGGKYPSGPVEDPSRNDELIRHSITILKHLLSSSKDVESLYYEYL